MGAMGANREYGKGLARGVGGALLFSFPLLMTMEMWQLGFAMEGWRLLIFLLASLPMLLGLSFFAGFEPTFRLRDEILDALAAFGVGVLVASTMLLAFGVLHISNSLGETLGKVGLCAVPAAIGALLAGKQFGERDPAAEREKKQAGYLGELFVMMVGAVFLAFNVAPTEEMVLIAYQMTTLQALLLIGGSILLLHAFVYGLGFPGETHRRGAGNFAKTFLIFTAPGYAIALLVSLYCLWTFGRLDGVAPHERAAMTVVLAFPAALGCATARLVI